MSSPDAIPPARWLEVLWPALCARVRRPVGGVCLEGGPVSALASGLIEEFLAAHPELPASFEQAQQWFASRASARTLAWLGEERRRSGDWQLGRDAEALAWERNPDFDELRRRTDEGALVSRAWGEAGAVLRRRGLPVLQRLGVGEDDAEDVFMETLGELTQARTDGGSPLDKMTVFEELPRFFATMIERRGISWLRKLTARKRQATNPAYAEPLDAPESAVRRTLADPRAGVAVAGSEPWASATFDRLYAACRTALSELEWHLVIVLFVEATHTRLDLASDPWVLEQLGLLPQDSESKRRRRLNLFIEEALAKLGRRLEVADV